MGTIKELFPLLLDKKSSENFYKEEIKGEKIEIMKKINCIIILFLIIISCVTVSIADSIPFEIRGIENDYGVIRRANIIRNIIGKVILVVQVLCAVLFLFSIIKCVWSLIKKDLKKGLKYVIIGIGCIVVYFWVGVFNIINY